MYIPRRYEEKDRASILEFIRANSFGIMISLLNGEPVGTHIPLLLSDAGTDLIGHISRGNDQKGSLRDGARVLAIFPGPHAYISPRWYTELNVPTWNYIAVHVYGTVRMVEGPDLEADLSRMVDHFEQGRPNPMTVHDIPRKTYHDDLRGIVGFNIHIDDLQAASKLSQNRDEVSHASVIRNLESSEDPQARAVAEAMKDPKHAPR